MGILVIGNEKYDKNRKIIYCNNFLIKLRKTLNFLKIFTYAV
jgi:hypothetical protein